MKQSLQLKMGQQLAMTPQLQQAIRMLQLSTLELQQEIQQALDENPLLEREDDEGLAAAPDSDSITEQPDASEKSVNELVSQTDNLGDNDAMDSRWEDTFVNNSSSIEGLPEFEARSSAPVTLHQHLLDQMWQLHLTPRDQVLFIALVDGIDDAGYLRESLETICEATADELDDIAEVDEVAVVLKQIHHLDPPGIGARDVQECLRIQLRQLGDSVDARETAIRIIDERFEALAKRDLTSISRGLGVDKSEVHEALSLIKTLSPRPGSAIGSSDTDYVIPDLVVRKVNTLWRVELNAEAVPRLYLNRTYSDLVEHLDDDSKNYIKAQTREAKWLIKSVESRYDTLLKVGRTIMAEQLEFLEHGEESMRPLILADIARQIDMHESTVSRATTQKFVLTPKGLFELKFFFSSQLASADGSEAASSTAIRAVIKRLVAAEPRTKPLSDSKLTALLGEEGYTVARRTVAKYREGMGIAGSSERKQLA
ncbi:RNA polymerase factor sigma-54 [Litorivicinus lipolyticus]|uniref:RNA polymerase factor sigma-54 n=1 Tax=Litorivicinus lipolyticus TaxID=418701 RepID=UPI003B5BA87B